MNPRKGLLVSSKLSFRIARANAAHLGILRGTLVFALLLGSTCFAQAEDLAEKFLVGLRARGWHDTALETLEASEQDPLASPAFLDRLEFERATTFATLAKQSVNAKRRSKMRARAVEGFQNFAASHSDSPQVFDALSQASILIAEQALSKKAQAERLPTQATSERKTLFEQSRKLLTASAATLDKLSAACERKLQTLPHGAMAHENPAEGPTRQQLVNKQAEARLRLATLRYEMAGTYAAGSEKHRESLDAAAEAFKKISEDYRDKLIGYYGRFYEGRCYQDAEQWNDALACYEDLIDQPTGNPDFRRLGARAYRHRAECFLADGKHDKAIGECRDWLNDARSNELKRAEWLAVAFRLAEAYEAKAASEDNGGSRKLRSEARRLLREVARHAGEFQEEARLGSAASNGDSVKPIDSKTFDEAFTAGKTALEQMNSSRLAAKLAANNNPEAVRDLQQQTAQNQADAIHYFQRALDLASEEIKLEDLLAARYYLCWLYWEENRIREAAVLGEFLARRYPESDYAAGAAKVALAALERLYLQARQSQSDSSYEAAQIVALAQFVANRWPDSPEAGSAVNLLIQIALQNNRLEDAEELLRKLPEANRHLAELNLGGALWVRYLQSTSGDQEQIDPAMGALKSRAAELLARGYATVAAEGSALVQSAQGVLYYVQVLLAQGEFERAIEVLENPHVGPLAAADDLDKSSQSAAFAQEAYKAALRAFISIDPPQRKKSQQMMQALEATLGQADDARQRLLRIYLGLGQQLQRQIRELSSAGKTEQAQTVAAAFEDLLQRISQSENTKDWKIRNWIAQSNLQLGEGLSGEAAKRYLDQAEKIYRAILGDVLKDPDYAPSELAVLGVRKRLADCLLAKEDYSAAFDQVARILSEKPNMLELQQAAAATLVEWGQSAGDANKLESAIRGSMPQANKKNLVWGWLRIAAIADQAKQRAGVGKNGAAPDPSKVQKYHDLFFEARYNVVRTRFLAAQLANGPERIKQLQSARKNIELMKRIYADLGGPKWKSAFNALQQQVEAELAK